MNTLNFATGLVTYNLNEQCEVTFNPTDAAFVERLFRTFEAMDKLQEDYKARISGTADSREIFEHARTMDAEMRGMIDETFGVPVCEALFGGMNVYALADGLPVWSNLMLAVMDVVDTTFAQEQKRTNPRLAKYTAKYQKK